MGTELHVASVDLLTGTLPTELGMLPELMDLDVYELPHLDGTLPTELGMLSKLKELYVQGVPLTGTLPSLDSLTSLEHLSISGTSIDAAFPAELPTSLISCYDRYGEPGDPCFAE